MAANRAPSPPTDLEINGEPEQDGMITKAKSHVFCSAVLKDPERQNCYMSVQVSPNSDFTHHMQYRTAVVKSGQRAGVSLTGLSQNQRYYVRAYNNAVPPPAGGMRSERPNSTNFFMNRYPKEPELRAPAENAQFNATAEVAFTWNHIDPDDVGDSDDPQRGYQWRYRVAPILGQPGGEWHYEFHPNIAIEHIIIPPNYFKPTTFYEWTVRTKDNQDRWGPFAVARSFYVIGPTAPPVLESPINDIGVDVTKHMFFNWRFRTPQDGVGQRKADIRWRVKGQSDNQWINRFGAEDPDQPGSHGLWGFQAGTLEPDLHYEWQVRTYDDHGDAVGDWSESGYFYSIRTPGHGLPGPPIDNPQYVRPGLGCGTYRIFVFQQGGMTQMGELTQVTGLNFKRLRDDISDCLVTVTGFTKDCGDLMKTIRSWMHEIVVFRDGERVWEGPVTRITYHPDWVEFEAKDCMAYLYRRIMRQGYNDAYRIIDGVETGLTPVTERAELIAINALAPWDPNVLPYLTVFKFEDDARQSRVIPDYSQTAWEQIDDLAATAGLDYTTVGRRIVMWDTHRPIGRLPEMTDKDFSDPVVVSEYGMQLSNYSAVSNGNGLWAAVRPRDEEELNQYYGPVETLASAYGESTAGGQDTQTRQSRERAIQVMTEQARRNIGGRWPTPITVRVPDNSTISPEANLGFDQLIPGVWIPLRATRTLRDVAQWQKLDSVTVTVDSKGQEMIQVVMSPAPNHGNDPDSGGEGENFVPEDGEPIILVPEIGTPAPPAPDPTTPGPGIGT